MGTVSITTIREMFASDAWRPFSLKNPQFEKSLKAFLEALDDPDQTGVRDGYIEGKNYPKIEEILDHYTAFNPPLGVKALFTNDEGAVLRQNVLKILFPEELKTAEAFLARNDLYLRRKLTGNFYSVCEGSYQYPTLELAHTKTYFHKEFMRNDFYSLPQNERLKVVANFYHYSLQYFVLVVSLLFPEFKEATVELNLKNVEKILKDILKFAFDWKNKQNNPFAIALQIEIRILYLKALTLEHSANPLISRVKEKARVELAKLSENEAFAQILDTDFDGIVDKDDAFPYHTAYALDTNRDQIPDELIKNLQDLKNSFGILEGKFGKIDQEVDYLRLGKEIYFSVNIAMEGRDLKSKTEFSRYRYLIKKEVEAYLAKIIPAELSFVHLLVNFFPEEKTKSVDIRDVWQVNKEYTASQYEWPLYITTATASHEIGHHFGWKDYYLEKKNNYFNTCLPISPRLANISKFPHLMNRENVFSLLHPVDFAPWFDQASKNSNTYSEHQFMEAEIRYRWGDFQSANDLYYEIYERLRSKLQQTNLDVEDRLRLTRVFTQAVKGLAVAQVRLYETTKGEMWISFIEQNIQYLELLSHPTLESEQVLDIHLSPDWSKSVESQEISMDAKIVAYLFARAQEKKERFVPLLNEVYEADSANFGEFAREKMFDLGVRFLPPAYFRLKDLRKKS